VSALETVAERTAVADDDTLGDDVSEGVSRVCDGDAVCFVAEITAVTVGDRIEAVTVIDKLFVTGRETDLRFCERVGVSVRAAVRVGGIADEVSADDFDAENDTESLAVVNEGLFTIDVVCVRP
jgi:hypothetical protein